MEVMEGIGGGYAEILPAEDRQLFVLCDPVRLSVKLSGASFTILTLEKR